MSLKLGPILVVFDFPLIPVERKLHGIVVVLRLLALNAKADPMPVCHRPSPGPCAASSVFCLAAFSLARVWVAVVLVGEMVPIVPMICLVVLCASFDVAEHLSVTSGRGYNVCLYISPSSCNMTHRQRHGTCSICGTNGNAKAVWMFPPFLREVGVVVQDLWSDAC